MSEVDTDGQVLSTFAGYVSRHPHVSVDSEGHVLVADRDNLRILLLNSQLELQSVLLDNRNNHGKLWQPDRLCYNELTSQLYVAQCGRDDIFSHFVSLFNG